MEWRSRIDRTLAWFKYRPIAPTTGSRLGGAGFRHSRRPAGEPERASQYRPWYQEDAPADLRRKIARSIQSHRPPERHSRNGVTRDYESGTQEERRSAARRHPASPSAIDALLTSKQPPAAIHYYRGAPDVIGEARHRRRRHQARLEPDVNAHDRERGKVAKGRRGRRFPAAAVGQIRTLAARLDSPLA